MFHSSSVRIPFVFWTSSFERFISCHRLRHLRPSAGQQKQLDGDQICDCQQKQVAFLRWTEGFLRNWYTIRNMWRWEEFPNHMGGMLWGNMEHWLIGAFSVARLNSQLLWNIINGWCSTYVKIVCRWILTTAQSMNQNLMFFSDKNIWRTLVKDHFQQNSS